MVLALTLNVPMERKAIAMKIRRKQVEILADMTVPSI